MQNDEQPFGPSYILAGETLPDAVGCRLEIWARRKLTDLEIAQAYLRFMQGKDMTKIKNASYRIQSTVT